MVNLPKFPMGGTSGDGKPALLLPLWFVRMFQLLLAIVILGLSAADAHDWKSAGCSVPHKVGFNIGAALITILVMVYLILSTGKLHILPHIIYAQLPLDFVLLIFWIAAAATSRYSCNDLCNNCFPGLDCLCFLDYAKRDLGFSYTRDLGFSLTPRAPRGASHSLSHGGSHSSGGSSSSSSPGRGNARLGLNVIELLTFLATTAATVFIILTTLTHKKKTTATGPAVGSQQYPQQPMGGNVPMQDQPMHNGVPYQHTGSTQGGMYPPPTQGAAPSYETPQYGSGVVPNGDQKLA